MGRDTTRIFFTPVERIDSGVGIGLVEYSWSDTKAIHSLFIAKLMSHRGVANYIANIIELDVASM